MADFRGESLRLGITEIREMNPGWTEAMVLDYFARQNDADSHVNDNDNPHNHVPGLEYKPPGEEITVLLLGDSNALGASAEGTAMVTNPNVATWGTNDGTDPLGWYVLDPNGPLPSDYDSGSAEGYTGQLLEGRGNMGWQCLDFLNALSERPCYLISYARNSAEIDDFLPGGEMYDKMVADVGAAFASTVIGGRAADIIIWQQGALDAALLPAEYADKFNQVYDEFVTQGWCVDRYTSWFLPEAVSSLYTTAVRNTREAGKLQHEYVRVISSERLAISADGFNVHFTGEGLNAIGDMCAVQTSIGPTGDRAVVTGAIGPYTQGRTYNLGNEVFDGSNLSEAKRDGVTSSPFVAPVGEVYDLYTGAGMVNTQENASQIIFGQRYEVLSTAIYVVTYRINVFAGQEYSIYVIADPLGVQQLTLLQQFTASSTGWLPFVADATILRAGDEFDLIAVTTEPAGTPVIVTAEYEYNTPQNTRTPASGEIVHARGQPEVMRISYTDNQAGDRTGLIQNLGVGDTISDGSIEWNVQSNSDQGAYADIIVLPAVTSGSGTKNFDFETVAPTPIEVPSEANYWSTSQTPNVQGIIGIDVPYSGVTLNDNAYGLDIGVQTAYVPDSADWHLKIIADANASVGGGGGEGGEANELVNVGGGAEWALPKSGVDLPIRTAIGGDNVDISTQAQTLTFDAIGGVGERTLIQTIDTDVYAYDNFVFDNISQLYDHLEIEAEISSDRTDGAYDNVLMYFDDDTATENGDYFYISMYGDQGSQTTGSNKGNIPVVAQIIKDSPGSLVAYFEIRLPSYKSTRPKNLITQYFSPRTATDGRVGMIGGYNWNKLDAVVKLRILSSTGSGFRGQIRLYGIKD